MLFNYYPFSQTAAFGLDDAAFSLRIVHIISCGENKTYTE